MDADRVVDVLSLLVRSNPVGGSDRFTPLVLELLAKLAAESADFPRLRLLIELHHPADPFARLLTRGREPVPLPPVGGAVRGFLERVLGTGRYRTAHLGGIVNPHPGDFHLTMTDHPYPVSVSFLEMQLLADLVRDLPGEGPLRVLEIGTGFGLSSVFLGSVVADRPAGHEVVTVDPFVEDRHTDHAAVSDPGFDPAAVDYTDNLSFRSAQALRSEFPELCVRQVLEPSPACFAHPAIAGIRFDLVFIDGNHFGEQPTLDFEGAAAVARPGALFVLHDAHAPGVVRLLDRLAGGPWDVTNHGTSCNLTTVRRRS